MLALPSHLIHQKTFLLQGEQIQRIILSLQVLMMRTIRVVEMVGIFLSQSLIDVYHSLILMVTEWGIPAITVLTIQIPINLIEMEMVKVMHVMFARYFGYLVRIQKKLK